MTPSKELLKAVESLKLNSDFTVFKEYLIKEREKKLEDLEDVNDSLQVHKLQGYCQALRDVIKLSTSKRG